MNKYLLLCIIALLTFQYSYSQETSFNMTKLGRWDDNTVTPRSGLYFNEVWGYVDGSANEYAIIGSPEEVHFIDVTNAASPTLKQSIAGTYSSIWRDFKSAGNYVYGVHDGGAGTAEGLSIYNMSALPGGAITMTTDNAQFDRAHNIFVDEPNNRLYIAGSNTTFNGLIVYDISNPATPVWEKDIDFTAQGGYVHDLFVRGNIAYCNSGSGANGGMWVYDLNDLDNIVVYAQEETGGYNHSSWMTDDNNYVVYATETVNFPLYIVNVSDVANGNITNSKDFKQPNLAPTETDNIAHNPLIKGDYCYVSYYEDGVQVWNISNPAIPTLAGYYDIEANTDYNGTVGVWGTYPFLPSGNILVSDDINGLYILKLNANLPVELTEFNARPVENVHVALDWNTSSELNNKEFQIERSSDGFHFDYIGTVQGNGTTNESKDYSFIDYNPYTATSYYRLLQIDFDGAFEYSEIESVNISKGTGKISIYPNPSMIGEDININLGGTRDVEARVAMEIYDINGRLLLANTLEGNAENIVLPITRLSKGVYSIRLKGEGINHIEKLVIAE